MLSIDLIDVITSKNRQEFFLWNYKCFNLLNKKSTNLKQYTSVSCERENYHYQSQFYRDRQELKMVYILPKNFCWDSEFN